MRREAFLPPGPWLVMRADCYAPTPDADPVHLYTDNVVAILPERQINNGQYRCTPISCCSRRRRRASISSMSARAPATTPRSWRSLPDDPVASPASSTIRVAARARANLAGYPNVMIVQATAQPCRSIPPTIYVNAGATQPTARWLDGLKDGGRLILPLTTEEGFGKIDFAKMVRGGVFRIERRGEEYLAKWVAPVAIFPCAGNRDAGAERALATELEGGGMQNVTRLYRHGIVPDERCWLRGEAWCFAYD